ncbi:VOC family protein [Polymorphobacter megasporae]|uniref:VOC family protein n=1 Tax=Glacieibacterium megasporae TaxID=2835787 RepID=UPI001C1DD923|nr:VOC family protein [Polymorphobacter megasporae]UAJ10997.1 VOC family protein [Polymorphobacter megasporae]
MKRTPTRIVAGNVSELGRQGEDDTGAGSKGSEAFLESRETDSVLAICSERSVSRDSAAAVVPRSDLPILEFKVKDVGSERTRLRGVVGDWAMGLTTEPCSNRSMLTRDPNGYLINVYTPIASRWIETDDP